MKTPVLDAGAAPKGGAVMDNFLKLMAGVHLQILETLPAPSRINAKEATPGHRETPKTKKKRANFRGDQGKIMRYLTKEKKRKHKRD